MFAMLEFWDYVGIFVIVSFFAGGSAVYRNMKPADVQRFARLEAKLDLVLRHLGLEYTTPWLGDAVRRSEGDCRPRSKDCCHQAAPGADRAWPERGQG